MAKRKSNKKAGKEVSKKTRAKGAAKSAAKKSTPHKPVDDKDKVTIEIPSDIEHPLEQTDITQTDNPVDVRKSDAEILTERVEDPQKEDQAGGVTEAIIEAAAETERLAEEAESLQTKDEQTGIVVEVKDSVAAENLSLDTEDTEANKPMGDISESVVEGAITTESTTEKKDDFPSGKQAENSTVADVESSDTEIHAGKVEAPQTEGQTEEITEAILEAAAETERLAEEADSLQTEDEQTGIVVEVEDPDAAESLSQDTVDTETDKSVDDVSESFVEDSVTDENLTEKIDDTRTDGQPEDVKETSVEDPDTIESCIEKADDIQTGSQSDEAILEVAAETERLVEDVESLQTDDKQTGLIVETEDSDAAESPSQDTEDAKADKSVDDVSESVVEDSVTVENTTEKIDDTKTDGQPEDVNETSIDDPDTIENSIEKADDTQTDNQAGEVIDADADVEETVIGDSAAENQTVVDRIKKFFSGIFRIDSKVDDSTQEGIESQVEAEGFTEGTDGIHADKQVDADEDIESPETVATHTGKADDIRTDNQEVSAAGDNFEVSDDEILTAVYSDKKTYRTKKSGIIISVFIVIAAVILLIVASIERRSAKKALVQISKVAESVKQMQEETLKGREQVTHSQIESGELVIDALSLTRNGLELERANSDEVEVKRIIGVFINDIDVRITKIKGNIVLLKNKLKEAD